MQVLSVKVTGQQASVTALQDRAASLSQATHDSQLHTDAATVLKRYTTLKQTTKVSVELYV